MSEESSSEPHTRSPREGVPLQFDPEFRISRPTDDVEFIDSQLHLWLTHPAYSRNLVEGILGLTDPIPDQRPPVSTSEETLLRRERLVQFIDESRAVDREADPYDRVFAAARLQAGEALAKQAAIDRIEALYRYRQTHMTAEQQYERTFPPNGTIDSLLGRVIDD